MDWPYINIFGVSNFIQMFDVETVKGFDFTLLRGYKNISLSIAKPYETRRFFCNYRFVSFSTKDILNKK